VFINQLRQKIGVVFGNPETTTGGNALKFYSSVRVDIRRTGQIKHGEDTVGSRARVKIVKNKLAPPFREAEFEILYGTGINRWGELLDLSVQRGLVEKSGAWYALDGERMAQGRDKGCAWLAEHPELAEKLRARLIAALKLSGGGAIGSGVGSRASAAASKSEDSDDSEDSGRLGRNGGDAPNDDDDGDADGDRDDPKAAIARAA
jgi:recombination protein RecA